MTSRDAMTRVGSQQWRAACWRRGQFRGAARLAALVIGTMGLGSLILAVPALAGSAQAVGVAGHAVEAVYPAGVAAPDPAAGLRLVGRTSEYIDPQGNTHLLGEVTNDGPTVESPLAYLDQLDASGASTVAVLKAYLPVGWLMNRETSYFDYAFPPNQGFSGKWKVDHLAALTDQALPSHNFKLENISGPKDPSDTAILHGTAVNEQSFPVNVIKVTALFNDAEGNIVYAEPTVVNSNDELIQPGESYPFQLPRQSGVPNTDVSHPVLVVEANEPGASFAPPFLDVRAAAGKLPRAGGIVPVILRHTNEHPIRADSSTSRVPDPTASDLAGFAAPGKVVPQHDRTKPNVGSNGPQQLLGQTSAPPSNNTKGWVPVLFIVLIGSYGILRLFSNIAEGIGGLRARRRQQRANLAALAPGAFRT